jgi:L-lactate dehydrogenase complex protein LldG
MAGEAGVDDGAKAVSARDEILANIRRALSVTGREAPRRASVDERLKRTPSGIVPARGQLVPASRLDLFQAEAEAARASLTRVESADKVPGEIARYLREHNLPATLRRGDDPRLASMPWSETAIALAVGRSQGDDLNGLSHAFAGVAETGTLILTSGPENPTSLNFLPDNHIVVVEAADIEGDYEAVWRRLRSRYGKGKMPRTVNMITGPSRSGDIEQTIFLGAHGPRRLHIVLVAGERLSAPE